ncbi:prepilin-type N-terminal cleavage/methylation domain-containing protein, partial [bacterium]|nr:prepilin-type N-terminal cleavage/methylation domain-containing protein [bacterium]
MKINRNLIQNQKGFSLIEVVIIIIVSAIAFAMIFPYFGTFITDSSVPIHRLNNAMELQQTA